MKICGIFKNLSFNLGVKFGGNVQIYEVKVGDKIGFKVFNNEFIEYFGLGFIYMFKVFGSVVIYDGFGEWFKVYEIGFCCGGGNVDMNWCLWQKDR